MLWSLKLSLLNIHVHLTAKSLLQNLQLLSGYRKNTGVFYTVDKNRPRVTPRCQPQPQQQPPVPPDLMPTECSARGTESYQAQCERMNQSLQQLQGLLAASNCKFQAIVVVLQQTLVKRDEAMKQRRDLSQELMTLRGELVCSSQSCDRLEREKAEVRGALEGVLQMMQEQHQTELSQLEERLRVFYQAEWDKVHLTYQEEADKCKALMVQQIGELRASHEALKLELETSHSEQIRCIKQKSEDSMEEHRKAHEQELQTLDKTLEAEATLSGQIQELTEENTTLNQRLKAEEDRRRELAERNQKDSLYLEQELESLKVVLDIKNKQLHQQDHKLMQMDKLIEKSVKLDECLIKVQQENEDLKARMDRHAALSRQLSTEQVMLQESLHKESKVNKRLSMENEELMWKLHNGDLNSPRKMSPTSPSHHSLSLQSPRSSAVFTSPIQSPRNSAVFSSPPVSPR
ncbi:microtubule-associated tumor suppressor 1 homolog A-like [Coregonus clupeaformis]|uniref:microtubule-associated tumor suppressor 1 homolog A-like n=1 Tax=Coregonus clupeaformis TaxID=59861 RepID=UPI001BDF853F|nr:microtubule-associated tumor suppressor 1 homolog A-like [Coregonus clupeaformis]